MQHIQHNNINKTMSVNETQNNNKNMTISILNTLYITQHIIATAGDYAEFRIFIFKLCLHWQCFKGDYTSNSDT